MSRQHDSDPLPFVQVDRSVKPRAALLAMALKVSVQHVLGSLIEWWELCGDPRELERIIESTPAGKEPAVILPREDVELRFELASGQRVPADILTTLGLLERMDDGFRVRGMYRYFAPIEARLRARKAASAGGKASVESRRKAFGSAQPRSASGSAVASESVRTTPEADTEAAPKRPRSGPEAESNPIGHRSSVIDFKKNTETASVSALPELVPAPKPPKAKKPPPTPEENFRRFAASMTDDEARVFEAYEKAFNVALGADWKLKRLVTSKLKNHPASELVAAIRGHASDPWRRANQPTMGAIFRDASYIANMAKAGAA